MTQPTLGFDPWTAPDATIAAWFTAVDRPLNARSMAILAASLGTVRQTGADVTRGELSKDQLALVSALRRLTAASMMSSQESVELAAAVLRTTHDPTQALAVLVREM